MHKAYLLAGSNLGNRVAYLRQAIQLIQEKCGQVTRISSFYQTAAWGLTEQPDFFNVAIELNTQLAPEVLMQTLLWIEEKLGRKRRVKMGPRTIDIDILLIDDKVINTPLVTVPHTFLAERRFALVPLAEIAPNITHPVVHKTVMELLKDCPDNLDVHKISTTE